MNEDPMGAVVTTALLLLWLAAMWVRQWRDGPGGPRTGKPW